MAKQPQAEYSVTIFQLIRDLYDSSQSKKNEDTEEKIRQYVAVNKACLEERNAANQNPVVYAATLGKEWMQALLPLIVDLPKPTEDPIFEYIQELVGAQKPQDRLKAIERYVRRKPECLDARNAAGQSPIEVAATLHHFELIHILASTTQKPSIHDKIIEFQLSGDEALLGDIKNIIEMHPECLEERGSTNETPLGLAVSLDLTPCVELLLSKGADPSAPMHDLVDPSSDIVDKRTLPIVFAASEGLASKQNTPETVELLYKGIPPVRFRSLSRAYGQKNYNPLSVLAFHGNAKLIAIFHNKSKAMKAQYENAKPVLLEKIQSLKDASQSQNMEKIKDISKFLCQQFPRESPMFSLLKKFESTDAIITQDDVNQVIPYSEKTLIPAIESAIKRMENFIIDMCSYAHSDGLAPLMAACKSGKLENVKAIIDMCTRDEVISLLNKIVLVPGNQQQMALPPSTGVQSSAIQNMAARKKALQDSYINYLRELLPIPILFYAARFSTPEIISYLASLYPSEEECTARNFHYPLHNIAVFLNMQYCVSPLHQIYDGNTRFIQSFGHDSHYSLLAMAYLSGNRSNVEAALKIYEAWKLDIPHQILCPNSNPSEKNVIPLAAALETKDPQLVAHELTRLKTSLPYIDTHRLHICEYLEPSSRQPLSAELNALLDAHIENCDMETFNLVMKKFLWRTSQMNEGKRKEESYIVKKRFDKFSEQDKVRVLQMLMREDYYCQLIGPLLPVLMEGHPEDLKVTLLISAIHNLLTVRMDRGHKFDILELALKELGDLDRIKLLPERLKELDNAESVMLKNQLADLFVSIIRSFVLNTRMEYQQRVVAFVAKFSSFGILAHLDEDQRICSLKNIYRYKCACPQIEKNKKISRAFDFLLKELSDEAIIFFVGQIEQCHRDNNLKGAFDDPGLQSLRNDAKARLAKKELSHKKRERDAESEKQEEPISTKASKSSENEKPSTDLEIPSSSLAVSQQQRSSAQLSGQFLG